LDFVEIPDSIGTTIILKSKKIIWFDAGLKNILSHFQIEATLFQFE
jgi:hypothetical protein